MSPPSFTLPQYPAPSLNDAKNKLTALTAWFSHSLENEDDSFRFHLVYLDTFPLPDLPNKDISRITINILGIF